MMSSSTVDTVTIDRLEYDSLLRDSALAEKVRGMEKEEWACLTWDEGTWELEWREPKYEYRGGYSLEKALGVEEVKDE